MDTKVLDCDGYYAKYIISTLDGDIYWFSPSTNEVVMIQRGCND
jgi:hypothetical protein